MNLLSACTLVVVSLLTAAASGQTAADSGTQAVQPSPAVLPNAPAANTPGAVRGEVLYPDQAPIAGAHLTLTPAEGPVLTTTSESDGSFLFQAVPPGKFTLTIAAGDIETASTTGTLPASGATELPPLVMRLSTVHTEVTAMTQQQAAEHEVRTEETQRILRVIPNFLVVYDAEPVPLSGQQKFRLSTRTLLDPVNVGIAAAIAGGEQASNSYPGFGKGYRGYARRFGANMADNVTGMLLTGAVLPTVFHQDPRYFYRGTGSRTSRFMYVLKQTVEQKGDNGHWQFAWSNTLGTVGAAMISDTYYPSRDHNWGAETGQLFGIGIASTGISNLMQEFVFGRVTSRHAR